MVTTALLNRRKQFSVTISQETAKALQTRANTTMAVKQSLRVKHSPKRSKERATAMVSFVTRATKNHMNISVSGTR